MTQDQLHVIRRQEALTTVFRRFSVHWSGAFNPKKWGALLPEWLRACAKVPTDVLEGASVAFVSEKKPQYPPKAWEFADFAVEHHRRTSAVQVVQGDASAS